MVWPIAFALSGWLGVWFLENPVFRRALGVSVFAAEVGFAIVIATSSTPYQRLFLATIPLYLAMKGWALLTLPRSRVRAMPRFGLGFYALAWPGMDPSPFERLPVTPPQADGRFTAGVIRGILGVAGLVVVSAFADSLGEQLATWLCIFCILTAIHLGFSDVLTGLATAIGWRAEPLFDAPWRSRTLSDFWSRRWNRPFVEMNRMLFVPFLKRHWGIRAAVFGAFLISGLLHEAAISYPAGSGWGLPFAYFVIQGVLVLVERRLPVRGPIWVLIACLGPLPILFTEPFRHATVWPLLQTLNGAIHSIDQLAALNVLAIGLAVAQILVLAASFQVPTRLRWREELESLSPLNRKLMWTYGSFIVFTIVAWAVLTFTLRAEMIAGSPAGMAIAAVIFTFWGLRLLTDAFYFKSSDWPKGALLQCGHTMLNCLFLFVFLGYGVILGHGFLAR